MTGALPIEPIGVFRSPYVERSQAPRQPAAARGVEGKIELFSGRGFEFALEDLASWSHIWVLFWFHEAETWRPKVRPPRSRARRGVFATRSPHRPNPIGLSVMELVGVDGLVISVRNVDVLDGSPVLDVKPYVAYTDAVPTANAGWLGQGATEDPGPKFGVEFGPRALVQAEFLERDFGLELREPIARALSLGPAPHPYRRIKRDGDTLRIAYKEWRARFLVSGERVVVLALATGYRAREISDSEDPSLAAHRAFIERFGYPGDKGVETCGSV